MSHLF